MEHLRAKVQLAYRAARRHSSVGRQRELAATGARPRMFVQTGIDALTASARRVARMAADGMTNKSTGAARAAG